MSKKKNTIFVDGLTIRVNTNNYISLTDIAKKATGEPRFVIRSWMKNNNTLEFLEAWETLHNPQLNRDHMVTVYQKYKSNTHVLTPKKWVEEVNAIGITTKGGRNGGTYAHSDIALNFCYWLSPTFQVYMLKEFQRLKEMEFEQKNLEWHVKMITDRIDDVRNLLDTIPGQEANRNRFFGLLDEEE